MIAFLVNFILLGVDIFFLTPKGPVAWRDSSGNPSPPHHGVPYYREIHLVGATMGLVIAAGFLSAFLALLIGDWPPQEKTED